MRYRHAMGPGRCEAPGPRAIDQARQQIGRDATLDRANFQAALLSRRSGIQTRLAAIVAGFAFGRRA